MSSTFECCCGLRDLLMNLVPVESRRCPNWKKIRLKKQKIQCSGLCLGNTRAQPVPGPGGCSSKVFNWGWFCPIRCLVIWARPCAWFLEGILGQIQRGFVRGERSRGQKSETGCSPSQRVKGGEKRAAEISFLKENKPRKVVFCCCFFAIYSWFP